MIYSLFKVARKSWYAVANVRKRLKEGVVGVLLKRPHMSPPGYKLPLC
jgi:hypothetical protein